MPVTFDFIKAGASTSTIASGASLSNTADGVTFTLSGDASGGPEFLGFGNTENMTVPLGINDFGTDDVITLTFESTANTNNTRLSGTATNPIGLNWGNIGGTWTVKFQTAGGTVSPTGAQYTITDGEDSSSLTFQNPAVTGIVFTATGGADQLLVTSLSANELNCFTKGTAITTPEGPRDVETLQPGDTVLTADGREAQVRWLGRQPVDVRLMHPAKVNPVRITAGALGDGLPERDLLISADHAIAIDGYLINAGALVNGGTIYQEPTMPRDGFTYYHVETEAHELLLAEGVAAESFIDYLGRAGFENGGDSTAHIREMALPRISSPRLLPDTIRARLSSSVAA
jgi:hypothetical protein